MRARQDLQRPGGDAAHVVEFRFARLANPQVGGARMSGQPLDALTRLAGIGGGEHGHAGQATHDRKILHGVVGIAEIAIAHAGTHRDDRDWQDVIANIVANLFETPQRREVGDGIGEDVKALGREAGSDACHVLFRHACVEKPIRKFPSEWLDHGKAKVTNHEENLRMYPRLSYQLVDECGSHGESPS